MFERSGRGVFGGTPLGHPEVGDPGALVGELAFKRLAIEHGFLGQRTVVREQRPGRVQLFVVDLHMDGEIIEGSTCVCGKRRGKVCVCAVSYTHLTLPTNHRV